MIRYHTIGFLGIFGILIASGGRVVMEVNGTDLPRVHRTQKAGLPGIVGSPTNRELTSITPRRLKLKQEVSSIGLKDCQPLEQCEMCTFSDQKSIEACKETGRKQKMECTAIDGDDTKPVVDYFSCKYTEADEQFAMIRFQMLCLLIGCVSLMNVRRQKRANASLFDQRKQAEEAARKKSRRSSDYEDGQGDGNPEHEIEFSRIDEETVPLVETSSNPLAVI